MVYKYCILTLYLLEIPIKAMCEAQWLYEVSLKLIERSERHIIY